MKKFLLVLLALVFITSCHIEKRRYLPGYSTSWSIGFSKNQKCQAPSSYNEKEEIGSGISDSIAEVQTVSLSDSISQTNFLSESYEKNQKGKDEKGIHRDNNAVQLNSNTKTESIHIPQRLSTRVTAQQAQVESEQTLVSESGHGNSDLEMLLLVILAVIAPPLAVLIETGVSKAFWIDLILALIGGSFLFGVGFPLIQGMAALSAIILALLVVFHHNPISSITSEFKPKSRPQGIPWTAFIFPPFALRWLDGVKTGEIVLACFLTLFLNYIGYMYVMVLISKYPVKQLTEEQRRIMKLNGLAVFFSIVGVIASFIYVSIYTDLFNQ